MYVYTQHLVSLLFVQFAASAGVVQPQRLLQPNETNEGVRAVCTVNSLTPLSLFRCINITNEGVLAPSSLPALTHLGPPWLRQGDGSWRAGAPQQYRGP